MFVREGEKLIHKIPSIINEDVWIHVFLVQRICFLERIIVSILNKRRLLLFLTLIMYFSVSIQVHWKLRAPITLTVGVMDSRVLYEIHTMQRRVTEIMEALEVWSMSPYWNNDNKCQAGRSKMYHSCKIYWTKCCHCSTKENEWTAGYKIVWT